MIHILPNMVSASFVADAVSCTGARPLMALAFEEISDITSHADALVVNMGQPDQNRHRTALLAIETAALNQVPITLDPVGAGASTFRSRIMNEILERRWDGIIKGNSAEMENLRNGTLQFQGVDAQGEMEHIQMGGSGRVFAVTGKTDRILASNMTFEICRGSEEIRHRIVGTGCVAAGLCGVYSSVCRDRKAAAVTALAVLAKAQQSGMEVSGYGTAKMEILNHLSRTDALEMRAYLKENLKIQKKGERL